LNKLFDIAVFVIANSACTEVKSRKISAINIKRNDSHIPSATMNKKAMLSQGTARCPAVYHRV